MFFVWGSLPIIRSVALLGFILAYPYLRKLPCRFEQLWRPVSGQQALRERGTDHLVTVSSWYIRGLSACLPVTWQDVPGQMHSQTSKRKPPRPPSLSAPDVLPPPLGLPEKVWPKDLRIEGLLWRRWFAQGHGRDVDGHEGGNKLGCC